MGFSRGTFRPKNPNKYVGKIPIIYRSSWEYSFMLVCDTHPNITSWASESVKIAYYNPLKKKHTVYIPDFLITFIDKNGIERAEIIEIKPMKETFLEYARSKRDKASVALNSVKWRAAKVWAKKYGLSFRVMTEEQIYRNTTGSNRNQKMPK